jgi:hypothetical protein
MRALFVAVVLAALPACEMNKKKDPAGVESYRFGETKLADAEKLGRCIPVQGTPLQQCIGMPGLSLGGQPASPSLYFDGSGNLVEIVLLVKSCDPVAATDSLAGLLGMPTSSSPDGKLRTWRKSSMFVAAQLPVKGGNECEVNFVIPSDQKRIADLEAGQ